jgi:hypothetical protein
MLVTKRFRHDRTIAPANQEAGPMERDKFPHSREETPWWRRERTKDLAVGFVLGFLAAGVAGWIAEKIGL